MSRDLHSSSFSFCFWPGVDLLVCHSPINSIEYSLRNRFQRWLLSLPSLSVCTRHFCFSSLWISTSLITLWPMACSRNEVMGLLSSCLRRTDSFCILPVRIQLSCCERAQAATWEAHVKITSIRLLAHCLHLLLTMWIGHFGPSSYPIASDITMWNRRNNCEPTESWTVI